jgi:acyl carrier protein
LPGLITPPDDKTQVDETRDDKTRAVLAEVRTLIAQVMGEDYVADIDIDLETSFNADLEVESIEFVALSEVLRERYGDAVDFVAWIADMEVDEIIALSVGELVAFIVESQES